MRPYLEKLIQEPESSLSRLNRRLDDSIPFQWHHHPEFELTLTLNSRGQRFIGDHVGEYDDGDLVLVGPNLPHTWSSREKIAPSAPHVALVTWFHPDWTQRLAQTSVELRAIEAMLARADRGLQFSHGAAIAIRPLYESLFVAAPTERLFTLLAILHQLSGDTSSQPLATTSPPRETAGENRERIDRLLNHIHMNYGRPIALAELADIAALSLSGLHRLFLKHTGKTISDYLIHIRIGDACARLSGTTQPIAVVADAAGYGSLANFNRQFRALKGMTPRDYRALFQH
ncbi:MULTISPECIES: AraC family transcriptional regulator [unclassified Rhizobium]|uniref:helix-turn-helix domain-containing protein n=1 Tax=unclassified Rhizobium TaxID=2613769 RepID=UPI00160B8163|nr:MULTISPECIES: AraC family transcriptional regulator [unclassified Rhizobium]